MIVDANFAPEREGWERYRDEFGQTVTINMEEHDVVIVGYGAHHVWIINPLTGQGYEEVSLEEFNETWHQFGSQAITVVQRAKSRGGLPNHGGGSNVSTVTGAVYGITGVRTDREWPCQGGVL